MFVLLLVLLIGIPKLCNLIFARLIDEKLLIALDIHELCYEVSKTHCTQEVMET